MMKQAVVNVWKCPDCDWIGDDPDEDTIYECGSCGSMFRKDADADGTHRCPGCNKFAGRLSDLDVACPQGCNCGLEPCDDAVQCEECGEWFEDGDDLGKHMESEHDEEAEAESAEEQVEMEGKRAPAEERAARVAEIDDALDGRLVGVIAAGDEAADRFYKSAHHDGLAHAIGLYGQRAVRADVTTRIVEALRGEIVMARNAKSWGAKTPWTGAGAQVRTLMEKIDEALLTGSCAEWNVRQNSNGLYLNVGSIAVVEALQAIREILSGFDDRYDAL